MAVKYTKKSEAEAKITGYKSESEAKKAIAQTVQSIGNKITYPSM